MTQDIEFTENLLKGCIVESIVKRLLIDCGCLVFQFGQEYTTHPLHDIPAFVRSATGQEFRFDRRDGDEGSADRIIGNMPDLLVLLKTPQGYLRKLLVEVKFRQSGMVFPDDRRFFDTYPPAALVVANLSLVAHDRLCRQCDVAVSPARYEELRASRLHVWHNPGGELDVVPLASFLEQRWGCERIAEKVSSHERLIAKWLAPAAPVITMPVPVLKNV